MSAFDTAMQALFNDANLAVDATFTPLSGPAKVVRVITRAPDVFQDVGQSFIETPTLTLEVRVVECPALTQGDQFTINSINYKVQGEPRRDSERLVWQVDVYAA